ncbi:MAG: [acyl-carrier-protein] S-malonyltransferase [Mycobacteriales bacterium]|jgi:[acyl-carrier-protein] S-malonyltransferase
MLAGWLDLPAAAARVRWLSSICGLDLIRLGTTADADEIRDTAVTQPLIVALGLVAAAELELADVTVTAGHSIGEVTAAALAGVFDPETAVALARLRGREMAAACALAPTGMSAVLGGDPDQVLARIAELGLTPANRNGAGQVVAAGPVDALAALAAEPPGSARVKALSVAGAFHTSAMAPAEAALAAIADGVSTRDPERLLLSNADGTAVDTGREMIKRLVHQVTQPVRWDLCQATLRDLGVTAVLELPPAGTLTGLARREMKGPGGKGVEILPLRTPDDLPAARDLLARLAHPGQGQHTPDWRVVVAPAAGTFHPVELAEGSAVPAGSPLGTVATKREEHPVSAGYHGVLVEWLLEDGDLVNAGEPVARLYPEAPPARRGATAPAVRA